MLRQRLWRWRNIDTTVGSHFLFTRKSEIYWTTPDKLPVSHTDSAGRDVFSEAVDYSIRFTQKNTFFNMPVTESDLDPKVRKMSINF